MRIRAAIAAATLLMVAAGAANADEFKFKAILTGAAAIPSSPSPGRGEVTALVDTDTGEFNYTVIFSGLSGPVVAGEFRGPVGADAQGPVVAATPGGKAPIQGSLTLTKAQLHDLRLGAWYFDVQTSAYPKGEIGGRLKREDFQ